MKARIAITVEVDIDTWNANYGADMTATEIRQEVSESVRSFLYNHPSEAITPHE